GRDDLVPDGLVVACGNGAADVATGQVDVDLRRAAGPAGLRLVGRGRGAAVARLLGALEPGVGQDLAGLDCVPLGSEAVVGPDERRRVATHQVACLRERLVGVDVGIADVALADG